MDLAIVQIPHISISPAPPEEPLIEPYSPFSPLLPTPIDNDGFRPQHLTPPPSLTRFPRQLSPLRPSEDGAPAKGLERERFEALLSASRERNAAVGARKTCDLRKEIALKAHKNKQVERRALFLSKILAPPSPTATLTPKTPPDSPAIFHYSLPSPGLVSPLALFESLNETPTSTYSSRGREPWVEQVDFRLPEYSKPKTPTHRLEVSMDSHVGRPLPLPSLDQISARLGSQRQARTQTRGDTTNRLTRLPAFLSHQLGRAPLEPEEPLGHPVVVGRLQMPNRARKPIPQPIDISPPKLPISPLSPNLQITTLVVPRSATTSPTELSESNLLALDSRERRAYDMLSTLRRRTLSSEHCLDKDGMGDRRSKWKRHSAPADLLPLRQRSGFEHPVLTLPGGF